MLGFKPRRKSTRPADGQSEPALASGSHSGARRFKHYTRVRQVSAALIHRVLPVGCKWFEASVLSPPFIVISVLQVTEPFG